MSAATVTPRYLLIPASMFEREDGRFAMVLRWATLLVAAALSFEADLKWAFVPKGEFVSVLGWLFPGDGWGSPVLLYASRTLIVSGGALWLLGPAPVRQPAAWAAVFGMLLLGSLYWENLPWFRHKYVPPFWLLLLLALTEHATPGRRQAPVWLREGAICVLALFYGGAGISKLWESGLSWCDGVALQLWFWRLGDETSTLRDWVIASAPLARFLAIGAMVLEVGSLLAVFFRWVRIPLAVGLLLMHCGIDQVFHIDFRTNIVLLLVILPPWFRRKP